MVWNLAWFRRAPDPNAVDRPCVTILIPARNEAAGIEAAVRAACAQQGGRRRRRRAGRRLDRWYRGGAAAPRRGAAAAPGRRRGAAPAGLKAWACWQLASQHARASWILFVDADVRLAPDAAARLVAAARTQSAEFVSGVPRQVLGSVGEALVVPLIHSTQRASGCDRPPSRPPTVRQAPEATGW